jgi:hypothetical protein
MLGISTNIISGQKCKNKYIVLIIMNNISKEERRKRLIEDFRKIARHTGRDENEMVAFAEKIPDEVLNSFEKMGYSSNKKVIVGAVDPNLQTEEIENE